MADLRLVEPGEEPQAVYRQPVDLIEFGVFLRKLLGVDEPGGLKLVWLPPEVARDVLAQLIASNLHPVRERADRRSLE